MKKELRKSNYLFPSYFRTSNYEFVFCLLQIFYVRFVSNSILCRCVVCAFVFLRCFVFIPLRCLFVLISFISMFVSDSISYLCYVLFVLLFSEYVFALSFFGVLVLLIDVFVCAYMFLRYVFFCFVSSYYLMLKIIFEKKYQAKMSLLLCFDTDHSLYSIIFTLSTLFIFYCYILVIMLSTFLL